MTTYIPYLIRSRAARFNLRKLIHVSFAAICPHSRRLSRRLIMHEVFVNSLIVPALLSLGYRGNYIRLSYDNKGRRSERGGGGAQCAKKSKGASPSKEGRSTGYRWWDSNTRECRSRVPSLIPRSPILGRTCWA